MIVLSTVEVEPLGFDDEKNMGQGKGEVREREE